MRVLLLTLVVSLLAGRGIAEETLILSDGGHRLAILVGHSKLVHENPFVAGAELERERAEGRDGFLIGDVDDVAIGAPIFFARAEGDRSHSVRIVDTKVLERLLARGDARR